MLPEIQDTIAAISTPSGRSFHAIIKISGTEAINCVKDLFVPTARIDIGTVPTYTSVDGYFHLAEDCINNIPAVLYIMKQPYSYTKEAVVEIHTLGSPLLAEMLLDAILSKGFQTKRNIRLSQPGEFTKRAFLHGRIDLTQAEATMCIIRAKSDGELKASIAQLTGTVSQQIKRMKDEAVSLCAYIEAAIDFSDQDIDLISATEIMNELVSIKKNISRLLIQSETGKISPEEIGAILYGNPNVGKSSLINALLGKKRAIVSEIPGTTRDIVEDFLEIEGIRFKLMDTAGIDEVKDTVISRAIEKTRSALERADIIILVFDGNADMGKQSKELKLDYLTHNVIVVINKCDLQKNSPFSELPIAFKRYPVVHTSALTGEGLEKVKEILKEIVTRGQLNQASNASIFNVRQRETLRRSLQSVQQSIESAKNNESYEFIALDLHTAIDTLSEIAGEVTTEDILDKIFSEFCIGK